MGRMRAHPLHSDDEARRPVGGSAGRRPGTRRGVRVLAAGLFATALLAAGCSSSDDGGADGGAATTAAAVASTTTAANPGGAAGAGPEAFEGTVDEFYAVPDPLPAGQPGDVIRIQELEAGDGEVGMRIMYLSEDRLGEPRAVTGLIFHPDGDAPDGGWPMVATGHGTTGIIPRCAPSRSGNPIHDHGMPDTIRVMTDYIGLGPDDEVHPYLSRTGEGHALLDSLVAVHNLLGEQASEQWLTVGHSQGGHAVLVSSEMAAERTPQFELLGTVAGAPGSQFTESHNDKIQIDIITSMVMAGSQSEWPDLDLDDYVSPETREQIEEIQLDNCLDTSIDLMIPIVADPDVWLADPTEGESREWMIANDSAQNTFDAPLLVVAGTADYIVVPARVEALVDRLCGMGQQVEFTMYEGADHGGVAAAANGEIESWLQARLAGEPAGNDC